MPGASPTTTFNMMPYSPPPPPHHLYQQHQATIHVYLHPPGLHLHTYQGINPPPFSSSQRPSSPLRVSLIPISSRQSLPMCCHRQPAGGPLRKSLNAVANNLDDMGYWICCACELRWELQYLTCQEASCRHVRNGDCCRIWSC